jgi:hypothetical protein
LPLDGGVVLEEVLRALACFGVVSVSLDDDQYSLNKGDLVLVRTLTNPVRRRMIHDLSRRFGIDISYFYHPELLRPQPPEPGKKAESA